MGLQINKFVSNAHRYDFNGRLVDLCSLGTSSSFSQRPQMACSCSNWQAAASSGIDISLGFGGCVKMMMAFADAHFSGN